MENLNDSVISPNKAVHNKKIKNKTFRKHSHLYLQEKFLKKIPQLPVSKNIVVLYLFNNEITNIENLNGFTNLTSLYLQNNKIKKIENLKNMRSLKKLYIGHNRIDVLEGLENMSNLEELHIEKQNLPDNNPLCIDPRTVFCLSATLRILNISHNNISSLSYLSPLKHLEIIYAAFNDIDDIKEVCQTIRNWYNLREATFLGNPITRRHRYREDIIANSNNLENLDGKLITDITRTFIRRFEEEKLIHGSKQSINIADIFPNLPKNYPPPLQKAVSVSMLKESKGKLLQDLSTFDESDKVYIAWKTLPKRKPLMRSPHRMKKTNNFNNDNKRVVINNFPQISNI